MGVWCVYRRLNPLTRIHCLPTAYGRAYSASTYISSQSPDEDSLSSDGVRECYLYAVTEVGSQSPDEDSLSSDLKTHAPARQEQARSQSPDEDSLSSDRVGC